MSRRPRRALAVNDRGRTLIATDHVEPRHNRVNPRVLKRADGEWSTKQAIRDHPRELGNSFVESEIIV